MRLVTLIEKYQERPWFDKYNTVTLYHGTTWENAQRIKREGLKPLDVQTAVLDLAKKFKISPKDVPDWVTSEIGHRRGKPKVFLTNSRNLAERYATGGSSVYGGEAVSNTVRKILKHKGWDDEKIKKHLRPQILEYGIVTIDLPWEEARTHHQRLAKMVQVFKKVYKEKWKEEASQQEIEFFSEKPIPKKYVVRIDRI